VYDRLRKACSTDGARVYPKVRVGDVIDVPRNSPTELLSFALRSHFDFTVVDSEQRPLFVVEYDGPRHGSAVQRRRDELKNEICLAADLPILRVTAHHLVQRRGTDLLTWIVDVWFTHCAFDRAQEVGSVPWEEGFDPLNLMMHNDGGGFSYPYWFSKPVHDTLRDLHSKRRVLDPVPSFAIARDTSGVYHSVAWLRLPGEQAIYATARLRDHAFPVDMADALEQIVELELFEKVRRVLRGEARALPNSVVSGAISKFQRERGAVRSSITGNFGWDLYQSHRRPNSA
jgi:hypothetical protein